MPTIPPSAACGPGSSAASLERALFAMAGTITLVSVVLAITVTPWLLLVTAFVGANQLLFAATGACPASLVLGRLLDGRGA